MKNRERAKLDSYHRTQAFNSKHAAELATISEYADEQTAFNAAVGIIEASGLVQAGAAGNSNGTIEAAKSGMAKAVIKYAMRGEVKAKQLGNTALAEALDEPESFILFAPKTLAIDRAINLRNLLNENLATLANISAENLEEIDEKINAYNNIKDTPVIEIQTKKATGTDRLREQFKKADNAADNMYSLVHSYFGETNPAMVEELKLAMQIIDTGIHHTSVDLLVAALDTNAPIAGATVVDNDNDKTYTTDEEGNVHIANHRSGHYTFSISASGKQTVVFAADIQRGSANAFVVKLGGVV